MKRAVKGRGGLHGWMPVADKRLMGISLKGDDSFFKLRISLRVSRLVDPFVLFLWIE